MKKYILTLFLVLSAFASSNAFAKEKKEVIIFSQPCFFCEKFKEYAEKNVYPNYEELEFKILDIRNAQNRKRLYDYVKKHDLDPRQVGLPLIFVGDNYIMGWSDEYGPQLTEYLDQYKNN